MVKQSTEQIDALFRALSDSTRREMLRRLTKDELSVGELALPFKMSLAAVSKHLKVLEATQVVKKNKQGRVHRCRVDLAPFAGVMEVLEELGFFWRERLDSLDQFLKLEQKEKRENDEHKRKK